MKAAMLTSLRRVEIRDVPEAGRVGEGDVRLRVEVVGVCGSDMHYYRTGRIGCQVVEYPWIVGHEFSATVIEAGRGVKNVRAGDLVAVDPLIACGKCDQCLSGRKHTCRNQRFLGCPGQAAGCLVETLVLPAECCFAVPKGMTSVQAALIEPLSIGVYATEVANPRRGAGVAVLGCGPIGLCTMLAMRAKDVKISATDLYDNRLALAKKFGAEWTSNASSAEAGASLSKKYPMGAECVLECAGRQETIDQAVEIASPGASLAIVGIPEADRVSFEMNHMRRKELRILNVRRQNECVEKAIALALAATADLDKLATHHFSMGQTSEAFELVADYRDGVIKAMIHVGD
jgi:L-iditol 2-dehydrogenase